MKKVLSFILIFLLLVSGLFILTACGDTNNTNENRDNITSSSSEDYKKVDIEGDKVISREMSSGTLTESIYYYEGDTPVRAELKVTFEYEESAPIYKETLEGFGMYTNFRVDGKTVICDYPEFMVQIYKDYNKEKLKETLEDELNS